MSDPGVLRGQFVHLVPMAEDHVEELVAAASDNRATYRWTPVPWDRPSMVGYVGDAMAKHSSGEHYPFATWSVAQARIVGSTRFYDVTTWDRSSIEPRPDALPSDGEPDLVSIGYTWLHPSAQRTPINTEAKLLMLDHAFGVWHAQAVRIQTDARNDRSRAAILRVGFELDGILRGDKLAADGTVRHSAVYSMLAEEWPQHRARLVERLCG